MPTEGSPAASSNGFDPARARAALIVLAVIAVMVTYVETMIIPGFETFRNFFNSPPISTVTWILTAYLVVGVVATPIVGKLGDIYGKKRVLTGVLVIYAIAVTVAGFTPNIGDFFGVPRESQIYLLIGVRAVQGIGVGMFPLAFAMIGEEFPRNAVAQAQGIVSAMFAVGAAVGLAGGAAITQALGWQATYHTVIPVAVGALLASIYVLRESRVRLHEPLDYPGAAFLGGALAFFLIGLTQAPDWGWGNIYGASVDGFPLGAPILFTFAGVLAVAFIVRELRTSRPIVEFSKMRERNIWVSNAIALFAGTAMFMFFVGLVILAELPTALIGLGLTAVTFGLLSLPATTGNMVTAPLVGRWIGRSGPKPAMLLGPVLVIAGGLALTFFNREWYELTLAAIPLMLGTVMMFIGMTNTVVTSSRPTEVGVQTGMNQTFRNLGTAIGPALATTILASFTTYYTIMTPGGPVLAGPSPTLAAFQYVFIGIAAAGMVMFALATLIRNYRFDAAGNRISLARGERTPAAPSLPAADPQ